MFGSPGQESGIASKGRQSLSPGALDDPIQGDVAGIGRPLLLRGAIGGLEAR